MQWSLCGVALLVAVAAAAPQQYNQQQYQQQQYQQGGRRQQSFSSGSAQYRSDPRDREATILQYENNPNQGDGNYNWRFATSNDIQAQADGQFYAGPERETGELKVNGAFSFVDENGQNQDITYTAGVEGYVPQGAAIPTPVPAQYEGPTGLPQVYDPSQNVGLYRGNNAYSSQSYSAAGSSNRQSYSAPRQSYNQGR